MYYDKDGLPISINSWAMLMESATYRVVKQDTALDGSWVSTVWLGFNHNIGSKKLHLFETMVFSKTENGDIIDSRRYSTQKEALKGHEDVLKERNEAPRHHLRKLEP
jgi:hypothetical protein